MRTVFMKLLMVVLVAGAGVTGILFTGPTVYAAEPMLQGTSSNREITLLVGQQRSIDVSTVESVAVGNQDIAAARLVGTKLLITGVNPGLTTLNLIAMDGTSTSYTVMVLARDPKVVLEEVQQLLGDVEGVDLKVVGDRVFVDGYVYREEDRDRVARVVEAFQGVVDLTTFSSEYLEVGRLVQLDYYRYEIQKTDNLTIGLNWKDLMGDLTTVNGEYEVLIDRGNPTQSVQLDPNSGQYTYQYPSGASGGNVMITSEFNPIQLNQDDDRIRLQDTHQIVVTEGRRARYVVGGELPIPLITDDRIRVDYKEYGAILEVLPVVDRQENIQLDLNLTLSVPDFSVQVLNAPALIKVTQNTDVTLKAGETVVVGGYIQTQKSKSENGLPALSQIPVLGYFFGQKGFNDTEREGVVFITPTITEPSEDYRNDPRVRGVLENYERDDFRL